MLKNLLSPLVVIVALQIFGCNRAGEIPKGHTGKAADSLAYKMLNAVNHQSWEKTGGLAWTYEHRFNYLWDRERKLVLAYWDDYQVVLNLAAFSAQAFHRGQRLTETDSSAIVMQSWRHWLDHLFWLYPYSRIFDYGADRRLVASGNGAPALLVSYYAGQGLAGKSYLWSFAPDGLPISVNTWGSENWLQGQQIKFENWSTLATGIKIAQTLTKFLTKQEFTNLKAATTFAELISGPDPFAELLNAPAD